MKRLKKKLESRSGESLLLALLAFLLCVMVAASILAAAVSNAGKAKSIRTEQQKYLTLSSALQLICEELQKMEYKGEYTVYKWEDSAGTRKFYCEQQAGALVMQTPPVGSTIVQPFRLIELDSGSMGNKLKSVMDNIFREQFVNRDALGAEIEKQGYGTLVAHGDTVTTSYLTVALPEASPNGLVGYPYSSAGGVTEYGISEKVTVKVEMDDNGDITLTAWLNETLVPPSNASVMTATLRAVKAGSGFELPNVPLGYTGKTLSDSLPAGCTQTSKTITVTWKLEMIEKET